MPKAKTISDSAVRVCNCAECGHRIVNPIDWTRMTPAQQKRYARGQVYIRIGDRPYCQQCRTGSMSKRAPVDPSKRIPRSEPGIRQCRALISEE